MGISIDEVRRVAGLARLNLEDDQAAELTEQLSAILDHFRILQSVDTDGVDPDLGSPTVEATLRPDEPTACLEPENALANAPDRAGDHFRVPRVIG